MEKDLNLTEAVHIFAKKPSARKADRLHELIVKGVFYIPVAINSPQEAQSVMDHINQGGSIPVATFDSPSFGRYLPVYTSKEQSDGSELPANKTIFIGIDITALNDLLVHAGDTFLTVVFDPEYSGLVFLKDRFLKYTKELLEEDAREKKIIADHTPDGAITETKDINRICDKKLLKELKRFVNKDKRIKNVWVYRDTYENKAEAYTIVVEAEADDEGLLQAIEKACSAFVSKKAPLNKYYYASAPKEVLDVVEQINPAALNFS